MDTRWLLSLAALSLLDGLTKLQWWQGWRLCMAQQHRFPIMKADLAIATVEGPVCQCQRPTLCH